MHRLLALPGRLLRRPRLLGGLLAGLAALAVAGAVLGRQLWARHHLQAARQALERYHAAEAQHHLDICRRVWPDDPETLLLCARTARAADDLVEADRLLKAYGDLPGQDPEARAFELALLQAAAGNVDLAAEPLRRLLEKGDLRFPAILEALVTGYLRTYRQREVLFYLQTWLGRQPDNPRALFLRGHAFQRVHDYARAADDYARVLSLDPEQSEARGLLAGCLLEQDRYAEAAAVLESLRLQRPNDPGVLVPLALARNGLGQAAEAARLLDEQLARQPQSLPALRSRGKVALDQGQLAQAETWLRRAVAVGPHDHKANFLLHQCLVRQGRTDEARALKAKLDPLEADLARATEIENRLMPFHPTDKALHYELGVIFLRTGQEEKGVRWLESALRLDPHYADARRRLEQYHRDHGG
jgi:Flp pilus assembly protein TadD